MATAETLQAEARERPRMAIVAIAAAVLTLAAPIVGLVALKHAPDNLVGQALQRQQHLVGLSLSAACSALGLLAIAVTLDFLLRATRARRPDLPWQLRPLLWVGGIGLVVLLIVLQVVSSVRLDTSRTRAARPTRRRARSASWGRSASSGSSPSSRSRGRS
jgi:membrane protease YdiL (CAAX protease family)